ncbi:hypothetical protein D3C80_1516570 [compost metagenome]
MHDSSVHRHVGQHRWREEEARARQRLTAGQHLSPLGHGISHQFLHLVQLSQVSEWPDLRMGVHSVSNPQCFSSSHEVVDELLVDTPLNHETG